MERLERLHPQWKKFKRVFVSLCSIRKPVSPGHLLYLSLALLSLQCEGSISGFQNADDSDSERSFALGNEDTAPESSMTILDSSLVSSPERQAPPNDLAGVDTSDAIQLSEQNVERPQSNAESTPDGAPDREPDCLSLTTQWFQAPQLLHREWSVLSGPSGCPRVAQLVLPRGSTWQVTIRSLPPEGTALITSPLSLINPSPEGIEAQEQSGPAMNSGRLSLTIEAHRGGLYGLFLQGLSEGDVQVLLSCLSACDRQSTRSPIVLIHGYAGVETYFGFLSYFFGIHELLSKAGFHVFIPSLSPFEDSNQRADQLWAQLERFLDEKGLLTANLIAHSQGGLDARILLSDPHRRRRVTTLTTLATPHRGIPLQFVQFFSIHDFSPEAMTRFNERYPDPLDFPIFSWIFRSCQPLDFSCQRESRGEVVDPLLIGTHLLLARFGENDGLVPTESMRWGQTLGIHFADHLDQVGQIADPPQAEDAFDHYAFYLSEARRLAEGGW